MSFPLSPSTTVRGIVRLDKVRSVYNGHIDSVVNQTTDLENGMVGLVGDLVAGERELMTFNAPTGATDKGISLIAANEIVYSQFRLTDNALENFYIPAGTAVRAYSIERGDIFSVSFPVMTAIANNTPVKGNYVTLQANSFKLKEVATLAGTEGFTGKIIDTEVWGTTTVLGQAGSIARITNLAVIKVLSN